MINFEEIISLPTPIYDWEDELFAKMGVSVKVKRDDLSHPVLSGNKFRKLKYALKSIENDHKAKILSFGGAYSNHLYAMAGVAKLFGFKIKMIVRGDELNSNSSPTLAFAADAGVELIFVTRSAYRDKESLAKKHGENCFIIPEGGSSLFSNAGVSEMVDEILAYSKPDFIITAVGTGGTMAGILSNSNFQGSVIGVPVLKDSAYLENEVKQLLPMSKKETEVNFWTEYHFGGYAKSSNTLTEFIKKVESEACIPLEHVYTGKLFFALYDQIKKGAFAPGSNILVYHSGGLQGKKKTLNN